MTQYRPRPRPRYLSDIFVVRDQAADFTICTELGPRLLRRVKVLGLPNIVL